MMLAALRDWLRIRLGEVPGSRIAVAVSGGADSIALAAALALLLGDFDLSPSAVLVFAHFNHRLRASGEHDRDRAVVARLAGSCGVPFVYDSAQPGSIEADAHAAGGIESAARAARYRFLGRVCLAVGARTVCTAHHADDQIETVLMRLMAGQTGVQLAGIPDRRDFGTGVLLCRPLLSTGRGEIDAFLAERNLEWHEDRSNDDQRFRRNRVRTEILPAVEREWPAVRRDLLRLSSAMKARRLQSGSAAELASVAEDGGSARVERRAFYALERDARLDLAYETMRRLNLLKRRDRPGHRFFQPLLGPDPGSNRQLIAARGMRVRLEDESLVFEHDIVRSGESRYLRKRSPEG